MLTKLIYMNKNLCLILVMALVATTQTQAQPVKQQKKVYGYHQDHTKPHHYSPCRAAKPRHSFKTRPRFKATVWRTTRLGRYPRRQIVVRF